MERVIKQANLELISFLLAALAHATLFGAVLLSLSYGTWNKSPETFEPAEEIAYETIAAPPAPKPVVHVAPAPKAVAKMEDEDKEPDSSPKEMQDQTSSVAGAQAAAKPAPAAAAASEPAAWPSTPFYKVKPKYPRAALVSGAEGWVALKVDVSENGEVENVRVIGGEQRNLFQDEARRAVEKWKYKPFLDSSGKPIKKVDHEIRVDFKLKDAA